MADIYQYLDNPNVRIMLETISRTEGTHSGVNPYAVYGGNPKNQLGDLSAHPAGSKAWKFKDLDGRTLNSTAAGRYQFINSTWQDVAKTLGLKDFSPRSQDAAAVFLMQRAGALQDVINGNFDSAIKRLGKTWASLPSSQYNQHKRSSSETQKALEIAKRNQGTSPLAPIAPSQPVEFKQDKPQGVFAPQPTQPPTFGTITKQQLQAIKPVFNQAPTVSLEPDFFAPRQIKWLSHNR